MSATADLIDRLVLTGAQVIAAHRLPRDGGVRPTAVEVVDVPDDTADAVDHGSADVLVDVKGRVWVLSPARATIRLGVVGGGDPPPDVVKAITAARQPKPTNPRSAAKKAAPKEES